MKDVLCIGNFVADVVVKPVEKMPQKGGVVLVDKMELHSGGCAMNKAIALAKMDLKTGVIGKIGNDWFGKYLIGIMKEYGMDIRGMIKDKNTNTSSVVVLISKDGERSFIHYAGATAKLSITDINFDIIKEYKILDISAFFRMDRLDGAPTVEILKRAKKFGLITTLDVCWDSENRWMKLLEPCLKYVDFFLPSYEEAVKLSGKKELPSIAKEFISRGVKTAVIKIGDKGCFIATGDRKYNIPAYKVKVVSTVGAGDSFVAGFLTGIIKGWNLEESGKFANAVGACCVTTLGASTGIKRLNRTLKFMKETSLKCQ